MTELPSLPTQDFTRCQQRMGSCPVPVPGPQAPAQGSEWERIRGTYRRPPGCDSASQCRHLPEHRGQHRPVHWHTPYQSQPQSSYQTGKLRSSAWEARRGGTGRISYEGEDGSGHIVVNTEASPHDLPAVPHPHPTGACSEAPAKDKIHYDNQLQKTGRAGL